MITRAVLSQTSWQCRITCFIRSNRDCSVRSASSRTSIRRHPRAIHKKLFSSVYIPKVLCENKHVAPYVRTCLSGALDGTDHTGLHVWFLGSGGSLPTRNRMTSATMLQLGGQSLLFDAGEGLQRQLLHTRQCISDISKIFITHLHADHVLGLPGMILTANLAVRSRGEKHTIKVYGPPGIYNYIVATLVMTCSSVGGLEIVVYELVGGQAAEDMRRQTEKSQTIRCGHLPSAFSNKAILREEIECNDDGTWTIQTATSPSREDAFDVDRGSNRPVNITAAEVTHLQTVQTFGFVVSEPEPIQKIDVDKATALGVAPGKKYRNLKNGYSVMSDDGIRDVKPEQVLIGANRKTRKFAYIGDNCGLSPAMTELCMNSDVLVHEAVTSVDSVEDARMKGHSSAAMAGDVARRVDANVLALNHISAGVASAELRERVAQAEEANAGVSYIVPSFDFMELMVPRFGFRTSESWEISDNETPQHHFVSTR